ncbi:MAG: Ppx/GppA family phosphatase [Actinomycetes bacterium]
MSRVAAVDLGTNSTRLLVADVTDGHVDEIVRRSVVTHLGEGVDAGRVLLPSAIGRVWNVLGTYRDEIEALGAIRTLAVATSAVRDSANGPDFLRDIEVEFGFATRLLTGAQEAELTRRGVGAVEPGTLLVDVGGGSTELILGAFRTSLDVGSVRLTERHLRHDPPLPAEIAAAAHAVASLLPELDVASAIGVAGTVAQLHALIGELTLPELEAELALLAGLPLEQRRRVPGMDPARAPVILGGTIVVIEVLRRYGLAEIGFSRRELLDGAALDAAS